MFGEAADGDGRPDPMMDTEDTRTSGLRKGHGIRSLLVKQVRIFYFRNLLLPNQHILCAFIFRRSEKFSIDGLSCAVAPYPCADMVL